MLTPQQVQQSLNLVKEKQDRERAESKHKETNDKLDSINESIKSLDFKQDFSSVTDEIRNIKIESPNVTVTVPDVIIPEIKLPDIKVEAPIIPPIKVPTPQVTVNVPEPTVIIQNQEEIKVTEPNWLNKIVNPIVEAIKNKVIDKFVLPRTANEAIPVRLSNGKKFYEVFSNLGTQIGGAVDTSKLATSDKQLPDNHQVTVSNPTANPETGLAKDDTLTDGTQKTQIQETLPDDSTKLNPAISCTRNANGYVTVLTMTANGETKTKTITRDVNDYWTNIGEWV